MRYRLFCVRVRFRFVVWTLLLGSAQLSSLREVAIVLVVRDCSRHIPSRGTADGCRQQLCMLLQTRRYLVRIPRRKGHSIHRDVRLARVGLPVTASTVAFELAQSGGISIRFATDRIEQRWLNLGFVNVSLLVRSFLEFIEASSSCHPSGLTPGRSEWLRRMTGRKKPVHQVLVPTTGFHSEALLFRVPRGSLLGLIRRELTTFAVGLSLSSACAK